MIFGFICGVLWFAAGYVFRGMSQEGGKLSAWQEGYKAGRDGMQRDLDAIFSRQEREGIFLDIREVSQAFKEIPK